jgi:hypothetical protein
MQRTLLWLAVAPIGIGLTTGLTITTTLLTQQPIGLASEPLSAGDALAPRTTKAVTGERPADAAKRALVPPHGGRALPTSRPGPTASRATPPASAPPAPVSTGAPPSVTKPVAPVKHPTRTTQPAPTGPQHVKTEPGEQGGGDSRPSDHGGSENSGSDGSGHGTRDD